MWIKLGCALRALSHGLGFIRAVSKRHPVVASSAWLAVLGLGLFLCILQSELLLLPTAWESIGRIIYRIPFLLVAPMRLLVLPFIPRVDYHWPLSHFAAASFLTPFFWWGCYRLLRRCCPMRLPSYLNRMRYPAEPAMPRRDFLVRSAAGLTCVAATGAGGYASLIAPSRLKLREYEVSVPQLPVELDGLRLAHVSDTHYGPFTELTAILDMVREVNALEPDLVALTGDYVHFTPASVERGILALGNFTSRFGAVAVLGNHEHWEGADACRRVFARISTLLLDNTRLFLSRDGFSRTPPASPSVCLAGLGDLWEGVVSFDAALGDVPQDVPRILLSHNPDAAEMTPPGLRVDLMLSGHTHGGQVYVPGLGAPCSGSRYGDKYLGGLCQGPSFPVIVSRGVGMAFLPVRVGVPPEIGIITLTRPASRSVS